MDLPPPDEHARSDSGRRPRRLLVVAPSWVGDAVMATPAFRVLRELLPGAFMGALLRPGIDQVLAGLGVFDEVHLGRAVGMTGPARVARKLRPRRYDTALLLTNSFSSALIARLAGIPRRIGTDRDARGSLLTERLPPLRRRDAEPFARSRTRPNAWAPVPACDLYWSIASYLLRSVELDPGPIGPLELRATPDDDRAAADLLERAGVPREHQHRTPMVMLNPGGNDPAKRWPADRFASVGVELARRHGVTLLVNGSPNEAELADDVCARCSPHAPAIALPRLGITLGTLKAVARRCRLMITNDTGPRHIAAAFGVPVVSLFGPTDHRWTTTPFGDEQRLLADPDLPDEEVANDHPERCRIDRISAERVLAAANAALSASEAQTR